jgi:hypothetical protein
MPPPRFFRLQVADLTASSRFNLRLWNETDQLLATHVVQIPNAGPVQTRWRGFLALDDYLEVEQGRGQSAEALMVELGEFLTQQVLGESLTAHLFQRQRLGTLFVELPAERRPEALELMRIPWELARYRGQWLANAVLGVQVVPAALLPPGPQLADVLEAVKPFDPGGALRVLLIFSSRATGLNTPPWGQTATSTPSSDCCSSATTAARTRSRGRTSPTFFAAAATPRTWSSCPPATPASSASADNWPSSGRTCGAAPAATPRPGSCPKS